MVKPYSCGVIRSFLMGNGGKACPWFIKYLLLSIFQLFCCCQITGILGLIFTIMGNSAYEKGDYTIAEVRQRNARTSMIIGWVLGALFWVFYVIMIVISIIFGQ